MQSPYLSPTFLAQIDIRLISVESGWSAISTYRHIESKAVKNPRKVSIPALATSHYTKKTDMDKKAQEDIPLSRGIELV